MTSSTLSTARTLSRLFLSLCLLGFALVPAALNAQDDRTNGTPTDWLFYGNATSSFLQSRIQEGFRIVDLDVQSVSPRRYAATMVRNSGAYSRGWWWLTQTTAANLGTFIQQNGARIIDLEPYELNGRTYFAAVLVRNTGAQRKTWWWYHGTDRATIANALQTNGARLFDLQRYRINGQTRWAAVMIRNSGDDRRSWAWYYSVTGSFIDSRLANGMRLLDLDRRPDGRFDCVMIREAGSWWWYRNQSLGSINDRAAQLGARVVDIEVNAGSGGTTYDAILTNNSNALTTRVGALMRDATDGAAGCYLKRVGGSVLASLRSTYRHDPASTLKVVHLAWAMREVRDGRMSLSTPVTVFRSNGPNSCPNSQFNPQTESLQATLNGMMRNSDNVRTRAITDLSGGLSSLTNFANARGMAATTFNHHIGCGSPPNVTTLRDLGALHETIAGGYLGNQRDAFYGIMQSGVGGSRFDQMLNEEAARVGLTSVELTRFKSEVVFRRKAGNYGWPGVPRFHRGSFAFSSLPIYTRQGLQTRDYVLGAFVNDATVDSGASTAIGVAMAELLREEVRAAMQTWDDHLFGSFTSFGSSCQGTGGLPFHGATGTPEIGQTLTYQFRNGAWPSTGVLNVGANRANVPLASFGATGCALHTTPLGSVPFVANVHGAADVSLAIPGDRTLLGATFVTQFASLDRFANAAGLTTTFGIETRIGGHP